MDAEQELKGRVSVDQWMMATTAQCQQHAAGGSVVCQLHCFIFQDDSLGSYQRAETVDMYGCFSSRTLAHGS